ncbi:hypothetical protein HRR83_006508 [Exophiala dermatitidis]|uniref:3-oxoacyl-[acyl-carrier protein] reductase n=2 Tax=Exophiala dermatitidis TaxID=5970 RepID=H6CAI3_EXODN|nr:uncharacterized protein HMPREF1120_08119 [Exophiala dermatitidis NIH/UT8656]KAJ4503579.1 hypothetical protein HRR75_007972 [Exophiala dermatitidis]EHY60147.1 hypothetical protein HMPREF1120_08119 [Exophiala dermatitidis NIH/UT8656]KAJ4504609.1 hypothetical protein HRR73_008784 [Exophiala dermatitidis]KAJ4505307.1 hypothetical protein HRR74_008677 [Exophiala dermatitidis]KAJ4530708.1 hypothetical protein HRR76_008406 [Exophiala dermatitidis]
MDYEFPKPPRSLAGKVAIVTGAGAAGDGIGNGRATAILLAEDGCFVACVDRDIRLAQRTVEMIELEAEARTRTRPEALAEGEPNNNNSDNKPLCPAIAIAGDVSIESSCKSIIDTTLAHFGRLDILINCVGVGGAPGTAVDVDMAAWASSMQINVASMVMMSKYAIPAILQSNPADSVGPTWMYRGSIVNMGSVAGLKGGTPHLLYPTAKGAIVNMTRAMAAHHAGDGIRVNCVCPGMVYTPMMYAAGGGMSEEARQARKNRSLLKTEGNGWDVGCVIRFLAGPQARWLTGVVLPVDAGVTAAVGTDIPKSASVNA